MAAWAAEALARAQVGQRAWAAAPFGERAEALRGFAAALGRRADALAAGLAAESGKVLGQAKAEVRATRARVKAQLQTAERVLSRAPVEHRQGSVLERVVQEPLGVVAAISSWNYPFFVGANVFASALAAGNAVLYKPSELVPETGAAITELLHEAGVPDDVFVNVGADREAGAALAALPGLGGIFFTGSVATGVAILRAAAPHATEVNLELGGKDPAYVRADADVAAAARALCSGVMYNSGQSCCSVERIYVHEAVYADFLEVGALPAAPRRRFLSRPRLLKRILHRPRDPPLTRTPPPPHCTEILCGSPPSRRGPARPARGGGDAAGAARRGGGGRRDGAGGRQGLS